MKLWDSLTTCWILLSAVYACSSPTRGRQRSASSGRRGRAAEAPVELPPLQRSLTVTSPGISRAEADDPGWEETPVRGQQYTMDELPLSKSEDVVDFIKVTITHAGMQRSPSSTAPPSTSSSTTSKEHLSSRTRRRRERKKQVIQQSGRGRRGGARGGRTGWKVQGGGGGNGGGQGCVLKQIHLNVSDLGLGYHASEEMVFKYCSGPCRRSETNYDKILYSLAHNKRLTPKDRPARACCRPIAYDDDLSFLDDNLVYHTVRKHSARKCACV